MKIRSTIWPSATSFLLASLLACTNEEDLGGRGASDGGSNSGNDWSSFFDQPATGTPTPDSVHGLWSGQSIGSPSGGGGEMRIRFEPNAIVVAFRCDSKAPIGGSLSAAVSSTSIKILESYKVIGDPPCDFGVHHPEEYFACPTRETDAGPTGSCFFLEGTSLQFSSSLFGVASLTKLSD